MLWITCPSCLYKFRRPVGMVLKRARFGFFDRLDATLFMGDEGFRPEFWDMVEFPEEAIEAEMEGLVAQGMDEDEREVLRDEAIARLEESLTYWLTFYRPAVEDVKVALKVGLVPFYLDGKLYLALGACGMDLSPKLDAYQALTDRTIDPDSTLFTDPAYFRYVVGDEVYREVLEALGLKPEDVEGR